MLWRREKVGRHVFSCLSLLLSTTVLNDKSLIPTFGKCTIMTNVALSHLTSNIPVMLQYTHNNHVALSRCATTSKVRYNFQWNVVQLPNGMWYNFPLECR